MLLCTYVLYEYKDIAVPATMTAHLGTGLTSKCFVTRLSMESVRLLKYILMTVFNLDPELLAKSSEWTPVPTVNARSGSHKFLHR